MELWVQRGIDLLIERRGDAPGWGYRATSDPATEPTVLSSLALLAINAEDSQAYTFARRSAHWLASIQRHDGGVGVSADLSHVDWPTPFPLLLWSVLGTESAAAQRSRARLLSQQGITFAKPPGSPLGHDTTIPGWSWVERTHSWLEPTALAVLALRRDGQGYHPRVCQGLALIRDRVIPEGGWNFGNNVVFGQSLRPKPGPTGLALLALAGTTKPAPYIDRSLDYLLEQVRHVRSAMSLGLGLLALRAWNRWPDEANEWLAEGFARAASRDDAAVATAYLLLASTPRSIEFLGLSQAGGGSRG